MCRYSATATLASWKKIGLCGGVLLLYIMAYVCIIVHGIQAPAPQNEGNQMLSLHENTTRYYACKSNTPSPCVFEGQDTHTFGMLPHS